MRTQVPALTLNNGTTVLVRDLIVWSNATDQVYLVVALYDDGTADLLYLPCHDGASKLFAGTHLLYSPVRLATEAEVKAAPRPFADYKPRVMELVEPRPEAESFAALTNDLFAPFSNLFVGLLDLFDLDLDDFTDVPFTVDENQAPPPVSRAERAAALIHQTQGRIFGAKVKTRSGAERTFNAKITADSFNEHDERNGLVTVFENNADANLFGRGGYRTIALEGVRSLRIDGVTYDLDAEYGALPA